MSDDSFSEVTETSWFSRIGNSIKGILVGIVMFCIGVFLLFWNEGRAVERTKSLKEGEGAVVSVASDKVDSANEGKLVHLIGTATTDEVLSDEAFGQSENALKLRREVEMYQWEENEQRKEEKKLGGGTRTVTTYTYDKTWSDRAISSANFKKPEGHENPGNMEFSSKEVLANKATLGAFRLSSSLLSRISKYEPIQVSEENLPETIKTRSTTSGDTVYIGQNPSSPAIGDMRVLFSVVKPLEISVVSKQVQNTFEAYQAKAGGSVELLAVGASSAENMFKAAHESNRIMTWILRAVGFFLVSLGLRTVLAPLAVLADVVPLFGSIVGAGLGIIAFVTGAAVSLLTIAIAWIFYRPVLGIALLIAAGGLFFYAASRAKKADSNPDAKADPPRQVANS